MLKKFYNNVTKVIMYALTAAWSYVKSMAAMLWETAKFCVSESTACVREYLRATAEERRLMRADAFHEIKVWFLTFFGFLLAIFVGEATFWVFVGQFLGFLPGIILQVMGILWTAWFARGFLTAAEKLGLQNDVIETMQIMSEIALDALIVWMLLIYPQYLLSAIIARVVDGKVKGILSDVSSNAAAPQTNP